MKELEKIINDHAHRAGNLSGISVIALREKTALSMTQVITHVNELLRLGRIKTREGLNHKLLFAI